MAAPKRGWPSNHLDIPHPMTKRRMLGTNSIHSVYPLGPQLYESTPTTDNLALLSSYQDQNNCSGSTDQETVTAQSCATIASDKHILEAEAAPLEFDSYAATTTTSGSSALSPRIATGVSRHSDEVCYGMVYPPIFPPRFLVVSYSTVTGMRCKSSIPRRSPQS